MRARELGGFVRQYERVRAAMSAREGRMEGMEEKKRGRGMERKKAAARVSRQYARKRRKHR